MFILYIALGAFLLGGGLIAATNELSDRKTQEEEYKSPPSVQEDGLVYPVVNETGDIV